MRTLLQLYVVTWSEPNQQSRALPFLWDGVGDVGTTAIEAIRGGLTHPRSRIFMDGTVTSHEGDLTQLLYILQIAVLGPWPLRELPALDGRGCGNHAVHFHLADIDPTVVDLEDVRAQQEKKGDVNADP